MQSDEKGILEIKVDFGGGPKDIVLNFEKLKPSKSLTFLMYMGKLIGKSTGKLIGSFDGQKEKAEDLLNIKEDDLNLEKLGGALIEVFDRIEEQEVIDKLNILLSSVKLNGEPLEVDHAIFVSDLSLIPRIAKKALGVNYKRFLEGSSGTFSKIAETIRIIKNGQSSPKETSTGSSGDQ